MMPDFFVINMKRKTDDRIWIETEEEIRNWEKI